MIFEQAQVKQFHTKHGFVVNETPTVLNAQDTGDRIRIMREEFNELITGLEAGDLTEIADGAADLLYTVLGTMVACGISLSPIFQEVHASNMTKERMDPTTKKGGKGPAFKPARVAELVFLQSYPELAQANRDAAAQDPLSCCANEQRTMAGGCASCGAPSF